MGAGPETGVAADKINVVFNANLLAEIPWKAEEVDVAMYARVIYIDTSRCVCDIYNGYVPTLTCASSKANAILQ